MSLGQHLGKDKLWAALDLTTAQSVPDTLDELRLLLERL